MPFYNSNNGTMSCFPVVLLFWALSVTALPSPWQENQTPEEDYLGSIKIQKSSSATKKYQTPGMARRLDPEVLQEYLERIQRKKPPQSPDTFLRRVPSQNPDLVLRLDPEVLQEYPQKDPQNPGIRRISDLSSYKEYQQSDQKNEPSQSPDIIRRLDPEVLQEYLERIQRKKPPQSPDIMLRRVPPQSPDIIRRLDPEVLQEYPQKDPQNPGIRRISDLSSYKEYLKTDQTTKSPQVTQNPNFPRYLDLNSYKEYPQKDPQNPGIRRFYHPLSFKDSQKSTTQPQNPGHILRRDPEVLQEYPQKDPQNPGIRRFYHPLSFKSSLNLQSQGPGTIIRFMASQNPGHILRRDPEVLQEYPQKDPQNPGIRRISDLRSYKEYLHPTKKPQNPGHILRRDPEVLQEYRESPQRNKSPPKTIVQKPGLTRLLNLEVLQDYLDCIRIQKNTPENNGLLDPKDYRKCIKFQKMSRPKDSSAFTKGQYPGLGRRQDPGVLQVNKFNRGFIKLQNTVQLPAGPYGK